MTGPIKHDAKWMHSNGLDSKDIGNIRGAKAFLEQNRPDPFTDKDANYLYGLVGKLAQLLDKKEEEELEVERIEKIYSRPELPELDE